MFDVKDRGSQFHGVFMYCFMECRYSLVRSWRNYDCFECETRHLSFIVEGAHPLRPLRVGKFQNPLGE